jgi:diaminopimelate decarboxylase
MARLAVGEGLLLDVATGGELHVALAAGVPAERCIMHGNNKSMKELRQALTVGVRQLVVDSFDELDRLEALRGEGLPVPSVQVRVTPGIHADTHDYIATGQDDSKFGFNLANGDARRAIERIRAGRFAHLVGVHCHIGSNVLDVSSFGRAAEMMAEFVAPLGVETLTLGGGLGVAYTAGEHAPSITEWGRVIAHATTGLDARVVVEPGRAIVASASITVYEVGTIKTIPGVRTYLSVDGGMSDNPRPVLYGSRYEAFAVRLVAAPRPERVRVVGKHCESGDVVIFDAQVPSGIRVGDLLATPVTGAYGHSMASNYNKVTRPPVVFVANGAARLVVRRETFDDLLHLDVDEAAADPTASDAVADGSFAS